jgi:3-oxoacyl-(acyl-carrier-protein) synthase
MTDGVVITGGGAVTALEDAEAALPETVRARGARVERVTRLVLAAGGAALDAAGLAAMDGPARPRVGVVVGTAFGCFLTNDAYARRLDMGAAAASPRLFAATVSNAAAGELGIAYRLGGPAVTLTAGTVAGIAALGHASDMLRAGRADALVAGGADATGLGLSMWIAAGGFVRGAPPTDAAAFVVLETADAARKRGAPVAGTILGYALGLDDREDVAARALADAGVGPGDVACSVRTASHMLAAGGPHALRGALANAPRGGVVLVVDACTSGHAAALVARAA